VTSHEGSKRGKRTWDVVGGQLSVVKSSATYGGEQFSGEDRVGELPGLMLGRMNQKAFDNGPRTTDDSTANRNDIMSQGDRIGATNAPVRPYT